MLKRVSQRLKGTADDLSNDIVQYRGVSLAAVVELHDAVLAEDVASGTELALVTDAGHELSGRTMSIVKRLASGELKGVVAYVPKPVKIHESQIRIKPREDWTTEDVCEYVVLPATLRQQAFFLDTLDAATEVGQPFKGAFVSQARQCRFTDLVSALQRHYTGQDASKVFLWMDLFSANQPRLANADADLSPDVMAKRAALLNGGLHAAIERFEERLLFFDSWAKPTPLTRMWCVWEVYGAARSDKKFALVLGPGQEEALLATVRDDFAAVSGSLARIEMREAFCHSATDRAMICAAVEALPGGFPALNGLVLERLRGWLAVVIKRAALPAEGSSGRSKASDDLQLLLHGGHVLDGLGDADGAERFYRLAMERAKYLKGVKHLLTASAMNSVASVLHAKGDLDGALQLFRETLAIKREQLGDEDTSTAATMHNLARVLHAKGDLGGAQELFEKALAVYRAELDEEHTATATTMHELACVLQDRGDLDGALRLLERVVAVKRAQLGEKHSETATAMHTMAAVLRDKGQLDEALRLLEQSLAISKEQLGDGHENVGAALCDLSLLRTGMGAPGEGLALAEQSLAVFRGARLAEGSHMRFGGAFLAQGRALARLGRKKEAVAALRSSLAVRERAHGSEHPDTAVSLVALAEVLRDKKMAARAPAIREKQLGAAHALTKEAKALVDGLK